VERWDKFKLKVWNKYRRQKRQKIAWGYILGYRGRGGEYILFWVGGVEKWFSDWSTDLWSIFCHSSDWLAVLEYPSVAGRSRPFPNATVYRALSTYPKVTLPQERTQTRRDSGGGTIGAAGSRSLDTYKSASGGLGQLSHITLPHATLDLSNGLNATLGSRGLELSTLV
jgi:hypothetical protein